MKPYKLRSKTSESGDNMLFVVDFGAMAIRFNVDLKRGSLRKALIAAGWEPPGTKVDAKDVVEVQDVTGKPAYILRNGVSYARGDTRDLGGRPGPMQRKVLLHLSETVGLTAKHVAEIIGEFEGSVVACMSGMVKHKGRYWVRDNGAPVGDNTRRWWLTERGRQALEATL